MEFHQLGQLFSVPYVTTFAFLHVWAAYSWCSSCSCWLSTRLKCSFSKLNSRITLHQIWWDMNIFHLADVISTLCWKHPIRKWWRPSAIGWLQADGLHLSFSWLAFNQGRVLMGPCVTHIQGESPWLIHRFLVTVFPKRYQKKQSLIQIQCMHCVLQPLPYIILLKDATHSTKLKFKGWRINCPQLFLKAHGYDVSVGAPMYVCTWVCLCWCVWLCVCLHVTA